MATPKNGSSPGRDAASDERAAKLKAAAVYWDAHKAHIKRLLTENLAEAVSRRNANAPHLDAVVKFGQACRADLEQRSRQTSEARQKQLDEIQAKLNESRAHGTSVPIEMLLLGRSLTDEQAISDDLTIGGLAQWQLLKTPEFFNKSRTQIAATERLVFHDEAAAQRAEALQTTPELLDYTRGAAARWREQQNRIDAELGLDAASVEYLMDDAYDRAMVWLTGNYQNSSSAELGQVAIEAMMELKPLDESLLTEASRDDEESRRLLTEIKDVVLLAQKQMASQSPPP